MPETFVTAVREWWHVIAFVASGVIAFVLGKERQRWRIDQIGQEVERQGQRLAILERQNITEIVDLAEVKATQTTILEAIRRLHEDLRGKADK